MTDAEIREVLDDEELSEEEILELYFAIPAKYREENPWMWLKIIERTDATHGSSPTASTGAR